MNPFRTRFDSYILPLLLCFAALGCVQSLAVWFRQTPDTPPLPDSIQLNHRVFTRISQQPTSPQLPEGFITSSASDYLDRDGRVIVMRWVLTTSTGAGVKIDPKRLSRVFLGSQPDGVCRIYDLQSGRFLGVGRTEREVRQLLSGAAPQRWQELLEWFVGLRPWIRNHCLFVALSLPTSRQ